MNTAVGFPYLLDNDRVNVWYYRDAPRPGTVVLYTDENYIDVVDRVTLTHVWLVSGRALRRPYLLGRLVTWSINTWHKRSSPTIGMLHHPHTEHWSAQTG